MKSCMDELLPAIMLIANLSMASGNVPSCLKQAVITPILKKPSLETSLKNYRPVSNLKFVSKVLERVVAKQIAMHIEKNGHSEVIHLLGNNQVDFIHHQIFVLLSLAWSSASNLLILQPPLSQTLEFKNHVSFFRDLAVIEYSHFHCLTLGGM